MKVVLLTYFYPPDQAVGALRPAKVAAAFRAAGHDVTVITARIPGVPEDGGMPGVIRVRPIPNPREAWLALSQWWRGDGRVSGTADPSASGGTVAVPRTATLKRWLFSLMWLPDDRQGFILPAMMAALPLIREGADLLYTTAPPPTVHVAGLLLKLMTGVRWAEEFRDPWTDNPYKGAHVRSAFSDAMERALEARCLRAADHVIAVSRGIEAILDPKIRRLAPGASGKTMLVRNGIDVLAPPIPPRPAAPPTLRIVHVGTFYLRRDPRPFLEGLALARPALEARGVRLHVDFVGDSRWFNDVSVEDVVRRLVLQDVVNFMDWVPHQQSLALVRGADMLLLLAQGQPRQVPNKLYEYLGTRRPILAFVDDDGESAELLREVGGHYLVTDANPATVARALEGAADPASTKSAGAALEELTTATQMGRLVRALERPQETMR